MSLKTTQMLKIFQPIEEQIVYDDLQERIHQMTESLDKKQNITQTEVGVIIQRAISLSRQIIATIEDIGPQTIDKHANMTIREFKAASIRVRDNLGAELRIKLACSSLCATMIINFFANITVLLLLSQPQ
ncbi:unnamed protein product [Trichogramma brassicae]|uniref:Uncharacterized protein n=1 Tax=Trichogramma brassicae TaxID=86971 RepID=A0A6H5IE79_9HYME|nr:unnamed protein product [Trichogramma brassicae]